TFVGTLHLAGWLLDALDVPLAPAAHRWARYAISAVIGVGTSWAVVRYKRFLDHRLLALGESLPRAIVGAFDDWLVRRHGRVVGPMLAMLALVVILADIYTNFTGGAAFFTARRDRS